MIWKKMEKEKPDDPLVEYIDIDKVNRSVELDYLSDGTFLISLGKNDHYIGKKKKFKKLSAAKEYGEMYIYKELDKFIKKLGKEVLGERVCLSRCGK